ncbi:MAG TPA: UMP kinase [archaeon]|nr:UMP kinase [archaeon]
MFGEGIFDIFSEEKKDELESIDSHNESRNEKGFDSRKTFVISLGGSVVVSDKINSPLLSKLAHKIDSLVKEGFNFVFVVGGGKTARDYVAGARTLGANNFELDMLGINASRLNAKLAVQAFESSFGKVFTSVEDFYSLKKIISMNRIPFFGGLIPGYTTDTVGALLAEFLNANFINLSNVEGVYSDDPKSNANAKFYPRLNHNELLKIVARSSGLSASPSQNVILDLPCCLILKRSRIRAMVLNADDLENLENAIKGYEFKGTLIESEFES